MSSSKQTANGDATHPFIGMNSGQIIYQMLVKNGVTKMFTYSGTTVLPILDAVAQGGQIELILPRHEQGAGHMAEGYARVTGKPGVALVTSGPATTNIITAMYNAAFDGYPMVVMTGQVPYSWYGTDSFQEIDAMYVTKDCTKWRHMITSVEEIPLRMEQAFKIATSGRPGPVLIDIPMDIMTFSLTKLPLPYDLPAPETRHLTTALTDYPVDTAAIEKAAKLINDAQSPIIIAGGGLFTSPDGPMLLSKLAHNGNIPVTTTMNGIGTFDETDNLALYMHGSFGSAPANLALQRADVIVTLGARFTQLTIGDKDSFAPAAKEAAKEGRGGIIQFELREQEIGRIVPVTVPVLGDVVAGLAHLVPLIESKERVEWGERVQGWKTKYPFAYDLSKEGERMTAQELIHELDRQTEEHKDNVIITTGVGQHQLCVTHHYRFKHPRSLISSGRLGTMGFGLPAAIGAKLAAPEKIIINVDGDSSFSMTAMELQTASQFNIGVKVMIVNNGRQAQITETQDKFYDGRLTGTVLEHPDFVAFANSMKVHAIRCSSAAELPVKLKEFLEYDGSRPVLMECLVAQGYHTVPQASIFGPLDQMTLHHSLKLQED